MGLQNTVIVPLYMYPLTADTFKPLHEAALANPQLDFVVILNPNSGPGEPPWWPDARYVWEIPRLNEHSNICTLGYVRTNYCKREIAETCRDVAAYSSWADDHSHPGLYVRGIFFDETPNQYAEEVAEYLEATNSEVKAAKGICSPRMIVHNPGTMPDAKLCDIGPDVTVVFEESVARYRSCSAKGIEAWSHLDRSQRGIIVHSVATHEIGAVVHEVKEKAEYLFVTELHEGYYNSFGPNWQEFIKEIQE